MNQAFLSLSSNLLHQPGALCCPTCGVKGLEDRFSPWQSEHCLIQGAEATEGGTARSGCFSPGWETIAQQFASSTRQADETQSNEAMSLFFPNLSDDLTAPTGILCVSQLGARMRLLALSCSLRRSRCNHHRSTYHSCFSPPAKIIKKISWNGREISTVPCIHSSEARVRKREVHIPSIRIAQGVYRLGFVRAWRYQPDQ